MNAGYMNLLRVNETSTKMKGNDAIAMPPCSDSSYYIDTYGFMVNRKSKNI